MCECVSVIKSRLVRPVSYEPNHLAGGVHKQLENNCFSHDASPRDELRDCFKESVFLENNVL